MPRTDTRTSIVTAAARILRTDGPSAVTTRAVAAAAGVQAPAIYRLFGDKDGLLDAVAEQVMGDYVAAKIEATRPDADPLEDLRDGWNRQIEFSLANPAIFRLLSDPDRVRDSPAARSGRQVLEARVHRVATTGRLRVSERRALDLVQASGIGAIQTLLATAPDERDPHLPDVMFEAVLAQILTDEPPVATREPVEAAVALRASAPGLDMLSAAERQMLGEWLDRVIDTLSTTSSGHRRRQNSRRPRTPGGTTS